MTNRMCAVNCDADDATTVLDGNLSFLVVLAVAGSGACKMWEKWTLIKGGTN